jgi:hypothetical protein
MGRQRVIVSIYILMVGAALLLAYQAWHSASDAVVVVEWKTASEINTAGFNLYRSDPQGQQNVPVNATLIPASPDPLTGGSYQYQDRDVSPGHTYSYELEEVEANGAASRVGRIEVKARGGGKMELLVSLILVGVVLWGVFSSIVVKNQAVANRHDSG